MSNMQASSTYTDTDMRKYCSSRVDATFEMWRQVYYRAAQKSKPLPNDQKSY